jgi:LL-diaminopimelate aminotransferase
MIKENTRMQNLPPYLFARIEKKIDEMRQKGKDIISLGIGDPDEVADAPLPAAGSKR